jgi:hypothetical protein
MNLHNLYFFIWYHNMLQSGKNQIGIVCLNSKFPPTLHSTLKIQPTTLFGEKCVRLYLLGYLLISVFTTQNFRIKDKNENLF